MFSYTPDESSLVILRRHVKTKIITHPFSVVVLIIETVCVCVRLTYTEEEREDVMLVLGLELVIWGYLMLEYSLSFSLFL